MPIFTDKRSLGGLEVVLSNKRRCTAVDFPILSRPSGIEQTTAPRITTVPRPATATIIAKENKVVNLWAYNCSVLLLGKKGKPNHLAACKRQVWLNTVLQLHQEKKIISTANLPSPTEGEIVIRIGVAAHLPNLMFKGNKWKEC